MGNISRLILKILTALSHSLSPNPAAEPQQKETVKPAPQYGKMVYSSKPQAEMEQASGEKLYKVSEGVYVDQATHDAIQSEKKPVIETEANVSFASHSYDKLNIICAVWHPTELKLICLAGSATKSITCLILNVDQNAVAVESETEIVLPDTSDTVVDVVHHPQLPYLLITCKNQLVVWDYVKNQLIAVIDPNKYELSRGGFYPDSSQVWALSVVSRRSNYRWLIWDYSTNQVDQYEFEGRGDYSRGATLHPSGLLIGAAWNDYQCGYLIHTSQPISDALYYYPQPAPERPEYEAYLPCFPPDGKRLALMVNQYVALHQNYSKIAVYNIETAELALEFHSGTQLHERQLQFAHAGTTLTFWESKSNNAYIVSSTSGKRIKTLSIGSNIKYLAAHSLFGYYAIAHEAGISVFFSTSPETEITAHTGLTQTAIDTAKRFIDTNSAHLIKVNAVE